MPEDVERHLREAAERYIARMHAGKKKGAMRKTPGETDKKAKDRFVYGKMTNMQKRNSITKWRALKR